MSVIGIEAYPCYWPEGWPRTPSYSRQSGKFQTGFAVARDELLRELKLFGATKPIISSNVALRRDGLPLAGQREPDDPAVAVYFDRDRKQQVVACDKYKSVTANIRALGLTIKAMRDIKRHGSSTILDRAFQGFTALPPASTGKAWWDVLGIWRGARGADVESAYRNAMAKNHPDRGGSTEAFQAVTAAYEQAKREGAI